MNQKDNKEKSEQLRWMSQIYSQATQVILWVGPIEGGKSSRETMEALESFSPLKENDLLSTRQLEATAVFFSEGYWKRVI
jgi:hypothetical protein